MLQPLTDSFSAKNVIFFYFRTNRSYAVDIMLEKKCILKVFNGMVI